MSDRKKKSNPLSDFMRERASVVITDLDHAGGLDLGEALAWKSWFADRQRRLQSSGGRPTNPKWSMKRQISFSKETWEVLGRRAEACSSSGPKVGPGQMAALLIEDAVATPHLRLAEADDLKHRGASDDLSKPTDDPKFDGWDMPAPFFAEAV